MVCLHRRLPLVLYSRATALIGRVMDSLPAISVAIPALWAVCDLKGIQQAIAEPPLPILQVLMAINSHNINVPGS